MKDIIRKIKNLLSRFLDENPIHIDKYGSIYHYIRSNKHTVIYYDTKDYQTRNYGSYIVDTEKVNSGYIKGTIHRDNGPAIEKINGDRLYFKLGKLHRFVRPAIDCVNGYKEYHFDGELDSKYWPAIIGPDGSVEYWIKGKLHRTDGPAIIKSDGSKHYYINGKLHRLEEPAVINSDGSNEWWFFGKQFIKKNGAYIKL